MDNFYINEFLNKKSEIENISPNKSSKIDGEIIFKNVTFTKEGSTLLFRKLKLTNIFM